MLVDLRVGSPAFGEHVSRSCWTPPTGAAVWVPEGVGHGFCALTDEATVAYLCTTPYAPERERVVHALSVGVPWPADIGCAPVLLRPRCGRADARPRRSRRGWLPSYEACLAL